MNKELSIGMALVAMGILFGTISMFTFGQQVVQLMFLVVSAIDMIAGAIFLYLGTKKNKNLQ